MHQSPRPRLPYFFLALLTLCLGLATRPTRHVLPAFVTDAAGDALWSLLVYLLLCLLWSGGSARRVFGIALGFSVCIEVSQLYHAPWLDAIRRTTPGTLVLGWGFAWTDLLCYLVGCSIGYALDSWLLSRRARAARSVQ